MNKFWLVEDDPDDVELFLEALHEIDPCINCVTTRNGKEFIERLNSLNFNDPKLIFMDVNMPELSGWDCLTYLKNNEAFKHIPVIMYSTSSANQNAQNAEKLGALCFYEKPPSYLLLKAFLQMLVQRNNLDKASLRKLAKENAASQKIFV